MVTIGVIPPVNAGTDGNTTLCSNDGSLPLFTVLNGSPDTGGSWTGPSDVTDGLFEPHSDLPGDYIYTVTATAPCLDATATVTIAVNPLPDAGENGAITVCPEAASINLFDLLGGTPMSGGNWTGPSGAPSNGIFDPSTSAQGVYTYTVTGLLPCPNATASSTATVYLIAPPNAGPDDYSCTLQYTLAATGNWASGTWTGPAGITFSDPTSSTSSVNAVSGGSYTLTWSVVSDDGCETQDEVTITFTDAIVPTVSTTDAVCFGYCNGTASVLAIGGNGAYAYGWSGGVAGNTPNASGICAGDYTVTVYDANNCSGSAPFTIGEPDVLMIDAIIAQDETCPRACDGTISINDPLGAQYSINAGGTFQQGSLFIGLCPGEYNIVMQDANGCVAAGSATIGTPAPVVAGFTFTPETLLVSNPVAQFNNTSSPNASSFSWDFAGIGSSSAASPSFTFPGGLGDTYLVCLTVQDANGCEDEHCAPIEVLDALLVNVPNSFTPNGDGFNDGFCPIFNLPWAVADYEFTIFDRWGELIHLSQVVHNEWDGWYVNGLVETEVYVWKLKCRDKLTNELIERIGHVTVLK